MSEGNLILNTLNIMKLKVNIALPFFLRKQEFKCKST